MKIVFRADASLQIGTGHVMRCRTLAHVLRRRGAQVSFICRDHPIHLARLLSSDGFPVRLLPAPLPQRDTPHHDLYASWLGVSEDADACDTQAAIGEELPDWLVVDHYGLNETWEQHFREQGIKILAIDDIARKHTCNALLDQNYSASATQRYAGRISGDCRLFLGPRFALLQPEYPTAAAAAPLRDRPVRQLLVFFGNTDRSNMAGHTLEALSHPAFAHIHVDVVAGPANPHMQGITGLVAARAHTTLHGSLPTLATLMADADLAVGAGGITTWERCCLGLPTIVISIAENQVPASQDLNAAGIVHYLGAQESVTVEHIRDAVSALITDTPRRRSMCEHGRLLVDGYGARRIAEFMFPSPNEKLTLRTATTTDRVFYYHLVNDPDVRRQSFNRDPISWDGHKAWFDTKMHDTHCRMFVLEADGLAVGQIRFDTAGGPATIDYSLDPVVRGRAWGAVLVEKGLRALALAAPGSVRAEVRDGNSLSRAVFDRLGFRCEVSGADDRTYHTLTREELVTRFSDPRNATAHAAS